MAYTIVCMYICSLYMVYILNHLFLTFLCHCISNISLYIYGQNTRYFFRTIFVLYFEHLLTILSSLVFKYILLFKKFVLCIYFSFCIALFGLSSPPPISCDIVYLISIHLVDTLDLQHAYFNL